MSTLEITLSMTISQTSVIAAGLPAGFAATGLGARTLNCLASKLNQHKLVSTSSNKHGLFAVNASPQHKILRVVLVLGLLAGLGVGALITSRSKSIAGQGLSVVFTLSFLSASLFTIWKAFRTHDIERHGSSITDLVTVHTGELTPDTPLLLAEHACTGEGCSQLWYYHSTANDTKMVSLVPKTGTQVEEGVQANQIIDGYELFADCFWEEDVKVVDLEDNVILRTQGSH